MIAISAESSIDLSKELLDEYNIFTLPFTILMGDKTVFDGEVKNEDLFEFTKKTGKLPKTSAVNVAQFKSHFQKLKDAGYDQIIHFSLSSGISSAYQNAFAASKDFDNVTVIDTLSLSTGIALLAILASSLVKEGKSFDEIVKTCNEKKKFIEASCLVDKATYLHKGGRCSLLKMLGANLLQLKPCVYCNNTTGKLEAKQTVRGNLKKTAVDYIDRTLKLYPNPNKELVFVTYTSITEEILQIVKNKLIEEGFKNIIVTESGSTIACHCGPDCIGVLYMNDGK